jgi:hypothetical protein
MPFNPLVFQKSQKYNSVTVQKRIFSMTSCMNEMRLNKLAKVGCYGFFALILALMIAGLFQYKGQLYIYILFSIASNALLYFGFRRNAIFFDTFIGIFFWLGFWLKLTLRICFADGAFREAVGYFDGSGAAFDRALLVAFCGMLGLLTASFVREKFIFKYPKKASEYTHKGMLNFYKSHRTFVLVGFVLLFLTVALTNVYLGIYQRGEITKTTLPLGLNGIYKWLLLFGLASVSAVILKCELIVKNEISYLVIILSLLESFFTNVSLLSRGMILNISALVYGMHLNLKANSIRLSMRIVATAFLMFIMLFVSSVSVVNYVRSNPDLIGLHSDSMNLSSEIANGAKPLFIDRWVGVEGVMAVSSSPSADWSLWQEAWKEKYSENVMSFYDQNLIASPYKTTDFTKKHYISLPGILAFCFYPGSFLFLFGCMFLLGLFAALIELFVFKLSGNNLILCALMAEVVAYRFASFGYVPAQSYLLFGTIFLNIVIIYFADRFMGVWNDKKSK